MTIKGTEYNRWAVNMKMGSEYDSGEVSMANGQGPCASSCFGSDVPV